MAPPWQVLSADRRHGRRVSLPCQTFERAAVFPEGLRGCVVSHALPCCESCTLGLWTAIRNSLVHLCGSGEWDSAKRAGELCPQSLTEVGFIHLSTPQQVHLPANRLFPAGPMFCCCT